MGDWTGTVPTFVVGKLRASKLVTLSDIATALTTSWSTWTPTLTNLTQGNGTLTSRYRRLGKTVDFLFVFTLGSTSAVGTSPAFTLPVAPRSEYILPNGPMAGAHSRLSDVGVANYVGEPHLSGSTVTIIQRSSFTAVTTITATSPFTWGTGDAMNVWGTYETS